jgi:hypothetical protein
LPSFVASNAALASSLVRKMVLPKVLNPSTVTQAHFVDFALDDFATGSPHRISHLARRHYQPPVSVGLDQLAEPVQCLTGFLVSN